jgi:alpha-tubulin suppressor-like RCC1 family protein
MRKGNYMKVVISLIWFILGSCVLLHCQIGNNSKDDVYFPEQIFGNVVQASAGFNHSVILTQDGKIFTTGSNDRGQLGLKIDSLIYQILHEINDAKYICAGMRATFFINNKNDLYGFGSNGKYEQIGKGPDIITAPQLVLKDVKKVVAGEWFILILKNDNSLWGLGNNDKGQLGTNIGGHIGIPQKIMTDVEDMAAGYDFSLIIKIDSSLWAMGDNEYGQLGNGTYTSTNIPSKIIENGVKQVSAGGGYSVIMKCDNTVWACGTNSNSQFGFETKKDKKNLWNIPVFIKIFDNARAISAGYAHLMVINNDNSVWAAGGETYNSVGQIGNGKKTGGKAFVRIFDDAYSVSAGFLHTLFIKNDNTLWACGWNGNTAIL